MNEKRDIFIFDHYIEKKKNATDSSDSFILLKTLSFTLWKQHKVYLNKFMGNGIASPVQPSPSSSSVHFKSVVQRTVFENIACTLMKTNHRSPNWMDSEMIK